MRDAGCDWRASTHPFSEFLLAHEVYGCSIRPRVPPFPSLIARYHIHLSQRPDVTVLCERVSGQSQPTAACAACEESCQGSRSRHPLRAWSSALTAFTVRFFTIPYRHGPTHQNSILPILSLSLSCLSHRIPISSHLGVPPPIMSRPSHRWSHPRLLLQLHFLSR